MIRNMHIEMFLLLPNSYSIKSMQCEQFFMPFIFKAVKQILKCVVFARIRSRVTSFNQECRTQTEKWDACSHLS